MISAEIKDIRNSAIENILGKQDDSFQWGFDERQARKRPQFLHYSPNFRSTLWTLLLLADIKAPADIAQIKPSIRLIAEHFYNPNHGIFMLPDMTRFPIPCLNGNMIYLHRYFETRSVEILETTIDFFAAHQRFDDGDFKIPKSYPYCSNAFCYGKHTCYWGVTKLLKGISFIPETQRTKEARQLAENSIDFVLRHEVCFGSHHRDRLLRRDIGMMTFPNFYKSDFLEILWLLAREKVNDRRMSRALGLLRSKMNEDGSWGLEKSMNIVSSIGPPGEANAFTTERAGEVLDYYGR